jgi:hypothetical protein
MTAPPSHPRHRPIPRPRKVTLRLAPHLHDELVRVASARDLDIEHLAEQIIARWLESQR